MNCYMDSIALRLTSIMTILDSWLVRQKTSMIICSRVPQTYSKTMMTPYWHRKVVVNPLQMNQKGHTIK